MPMSLAEAREILARANRMIANEGVLDAFGHVTMRHPGDPERYLMARSLAPELVQPEDIHEFTLDSEIVKPIKERLYSERVIHGEIYKARPDVNAVCHHHAPSMLPFCVTGMTMKPLNHLGATMGAQGAGVGQPRRVRQHQSAGGEAGGRRLARARARAALDRADAPARRHRCRPHAGGTDLPHHLHRAQRRGADPGRIAGRRA